MHARRSPHSAVFVFALFAWLGTAVAVRPATAQTEGLLQIDNSLHAFLLRQQTAGLLPDAHLSHHPLSAYEARRYLDSLDVRSEALSAVDRVLLDRYLGRRAGPGAAWVQQRVGWLYPNGQNLIAASGEGFSLQVDPLLYLTVGRAQRSARDGRDGSTTVWQNTRGVRAAGHIGPYIFFETRIEENQRRDAVPVDPRLVKRTVPRLGAVDFSDGVYDYTQAMGVLGVRTRFFEVRLGRDRNRWGFGRTSLVLNDYAPAYDQLQIRTSVWRVQYTNVFAGFEDLSDLPPGFLLRDIVPRKYGAFHRLAIDLPAGVQAELFESVLFSTPDSTGKRAKGFDLSYLNPIIFYSAVEKDRGSPDNTAIGGGLSWVALPGARLYTQVLIDDLDVSQIGEGFARNRVGWLAGLHLAGLVVPTLSLQIEYARLRPFLYSHRDVTRSYVHWNDLLGHPAGSNAQDVAFFADYQPLPALHLAVNLSYTQRGRNPVAEDGTVENVGGDPLLSTNTRLRETGYDLLGGVRQDVWLVEAYAGYEFLPGLFAEAALRAESLDDAQTGKDRYVAPLVSLRWGLPFRSVRY